MSVTTETGGVEYAVQIRDGETVIGTTDPIGTHGEAQTRLRAMQRAYLDSTLMYRLGGMGAWEAATDEVLAQIVYRHTAHILAELVGEGLTPIHWDLRPYMPDEIVGTATTGATASRDAVAEYGALLKAEPVEKASSRDGHVNVSVSGTYRGVEVTVSALVVAVPAVPVSVSAERAGA